MIACPSIYIGSWVYLFITIRGITRIKPEALIAYSSVPFNSHNFIMTVFSLHLHCLMVGIMKQTVLPTISGKAVGASSQCYNSDELILLMFELMLVKCQINTKWLYNWQKDLNNWNLAWVLSMSIVSTLSEYFVESKNTFLVVFVLILHL